MNKKTNVPYFKKYQIIWLSSICNLSIYFKRRDRERERLRKSR